MEMNLCVLRSEKEKKSKIFPKIHQKVPKKICIVRFMTQYVCYNEVTKKETEIDNVTFGKGEIK